MRVAFLGLGHMGLPMALNLVKAGHDVTGFDVVPAAIDAARAAGIPVADSGQDAAASAEVVITMFPSGRHVIDAYRGSSDADGLLAVAASGTLFIDSSTIAVDEAREAHALAEAAGHRSVDAPVSGGVVGAENATLAFMVGGFRRGLRGGPASARGDGAPGRALRRGRARPGRQGLQQHDPRYLADRRGRGIRAR